MQKRFILIIIILILKVTIVLGASQGVVEFWMQTLQNNELDPIVKIMEKGDVPWLRIQSKEFYEKLVAVEQQSSFNNITLAQELFKKMKEYDERNISLEGFEVVMTYAKLSFELRKCGGYANHVLSDTANRLVLSRLCSYLIKNPKNYEQVQTQLNLIKEQCSLSKELLNTIAEELSINRSDNKFKSIPESKLMDELLSMLGVDFRGLVGSLDPYAVSTSKVLLKKNLSSLLWRVGEVDMISKVSLPGLVEFFKCGGQPNDIRLEDATRFKVLMKDKRNLFKSEAMDVDRLSASHLYGLINAFKNGYPKATFYLLAVE